MDGGVLSRAVLGAILALVVLLGSGCGANVKPISMEDKRALTPELEVSHSLSPKISLQASASRTAGEADQLGRVEDHDELHLDSLRFEQPEDLAVDFTLDTLALGVGIQLIDASRLGLRLDTGFRYARLDLTLEDADGQRYRHVGQGYGPGVDIRGQIPITQRLSGEIFFGSAFRIRGETGQHWAQGLRLVFAAHERVKLFAGWRRGGYSTREYDREYVAIGRGFNAGLALEF